MCRNPLTSLGHAHWGCAPIPVRFFGEAASGSDSAGALRGRARTDPCPLFVLADGVGLDRTRGNTTGPGSAGTRAVAASSSTPAACCERRASTESSSSRGYPCTTTARTTASRRRMRWSCSSTEATRRRGTWREHSSAATAPSGGTWAATMSAAWRHWPRAPVGVAGGAASRPRAPASSCG